MRTYIAILKGINVGGHKKILMADLRKLLSEIPSIEEVKTYIQSGNIAFKASEENSDILENVIQEKIANHYEFQVNTIVLSKEKLSGIIAENPYAQQDIKRLHCCFFKKEPIFENREKLENYDASPDAFEVEKNCMYICCETDRYSKSNINNSIAEKILKINCTTRNWKTCIKLLEMVKSL